MSYPPALDEGEAQRLNQKSIRGWIEENKGKIKAKPNQTILYSGRDYDLEVIKGLSLEDRKEFMGTPMWKRIEQTRKQMRDLEVPCGFQTLEDVLKSIRNHPKFITRDRQELRYSSAFEFFNEVQGQSKLLPDAKRVSRESWDRLSEIFAGNAVGSLQILDGAADDYSKLREDKIFIRKELEALLRNPKLSLVGKKLVLEKIAKYSDNFDRRYTKLIQLLDKEQSRLKPR